MGMLRLLRVAGVAGVAATGAAWARDGRAGRAPDPVRQRAIASVDPDLCRGSAFAPFEPDPPARRRRRT